MRWMRLFCSFLRFGADGEGIEDAGAEGVADGFGRFATRSPWPRIFMPTMAFSLGAHLLDDFDYGVGVGIHVRAMGLRRTRSTSTHGEAAAALSAPMLWQETPCARMTPFCFASERTSMTPR